MQSRGNSEDACEACPMTICKDGRTAQELTLTGWRFAAVSACVFLVPLLLAIFGASVAGGGSARRFFGGLTGMVSGMAIGIITSRFVRSKSEGTES